VTGLQRLRLTAIASALLVVWASSASGQETAPIAIGSGVFTQPQADRGERWYRAMCTRCHGIDLHAMITEVPSLTDIAFEVNWTGRSVADLYNTIRYTMPAIARQTMPFEHPGAREFLDENIVADLAAYILSFNGYPAGASELTPDVGTLERIEITDPTP
jgi:cytochrome c553